MLDFSAKRKRLVNLPTPHHEPVDEVVDTLPSSDAPLADIPFWRLEEYRFVGKEEETSTTTTTVTEQPAQKDSDLAQQIPEQQLLAPWRELKPRLRSRLSAPRVGHAIDIDLAVRKVCRGELLINIPCKRRRRWGPHVQLIEDRSQRLTPLWEDQRDLRVAFTARFAGRCVDAGGVSGGPAFTFADG